MHQFLVEARPGVAFGAFRTRHVPKNWTSGLGRGVLRIADVRSRYSPLPYGDQCLFLRTAVFRRVGGFPELPLMEDLELSRRLTGISKPAIINSPVVTSSRRWESEGIIKTILLMWCLQLGFRLGVPANTLARWYR